MYCVECPKYCLATQMTLTMPRDLHIVTAWRSPDNVIRKKTQHDMSKVLHLPREMTMEVSKILRLPRKVPFSYTQLLKRAHWACHTERLWTPDETSWNVTKCHACQTKQGFATFETAFAAVPIGTAIAASQERLRTVADCCGRLAERTLADAKGPSSEHNLNHAFGKKQQIPASITSKTCNDNFQTEECWPSMFCKHAMHFLRIIFLERDLPQSVL